MEVKVLRRGMLTTVQDLGRPGYRAEGVPSGGAMDAFAHRVANLLVGNDDDCATLEFTLLGPTLEFSRDTLVAVCGGRFRGTEPWTARRVTAGSVLEIGTAESGCRGYLAIAGGFDVAPVLGSRSTYLRAGFGGLGRAVRDGDILQAPDVTRDIAGGWHIAPSMVPAYSAAPTVRAVAGAHVDEFRDGLRDAVYRVSAQSDRMGVRLQGPAMLRSGGADIRSMTVAPGTIQIPPDGQPIVLMCEAQTIGGYPQIAHVIAADLPLIAQLRPGDRLRFQEVTLREAHAHLLARERALGMLRQGIALKLR